MRRRYLLFEATVLFVGLPVLVAMLLRGRPFFPVLWAAALGCGLLLWRDPAFPRRALWNAAACRRGLAPVLRRFAVAAVLLTLLTRAWQPDWFFYLPRARPRLWLLIMVCYPVLSAYPQGVISRAFMFHRYRGLVPAGRPMVLVSGLVFAFSHIIFFNVTALLLTFAGGLMFAQTYRRSGSLLLSALEHALYGNLLFTIGLGALVYHGNA